MPTRRAEPINLGTFSLRARKGADGNIHLYFEALERQRAPRITPDDLAAMVAASAPRCRDPLKTAVRSRRVSP